MISDFKRHKHHLSSSFCGAIAITLTFHLLMAEDRDCPGMALAVSVFLGLPIGAAIGVAIYKLFSHSLISTDIVGLIVGLFFSFALEFVVLGSANFFGPFVFLAALVLTPVCMILGCIAVGSRTGCCGR
ncbi:MAG: hypothetical protein AB9866_31040 [Syntrophobacteraceae bacterium]